MFCESPCVSPSVIEGISPFGIEGGPLPFESDISGGVSPKPPVGTEPSEFVELSVPSEELSELLGGVCEKDLSLVVFVLSAADFVCAV